MSDIARFKILPNGNIAVWVSKQYKQHLRPQFSVGDVLKDPFGNDLTVINVGTETDLELLRKDNVGRINTCYFVRDDMGDTSIWSEYELLVNNRATNESVHDLIQTLSRKGAAV